MKTAVISIVLVLIFLISFVVHVDQKWLGPRGATYVDDLNIQEAFLDRVSNVLILITNDKWISLDLKSVPGGVFAHWKNFKPGKPPVGQSRQMEPVAILTSERATFDFYNFHRDGLARVNAGQPVIIPNGYGAALCQAPAKEGKDGVTWFKSYVLVTPFKEPDGRYGVQFFYHPDYVRSVIFRPPNLLLAIFGPAYLALCIALPLAFSNLRTLATSLLFILAFILLGVSFAIDFGLIRVGESTSGYSPGHNDASSFMIKGAAVLAGLICVRCVRAFFHSHRRVELVSSTEAQ